MSKYKGKKILVVGLGRSGLAVCKYLVKQGARVTVTDLKQKHELKDAVKALGDLKIEMDLGRHNPQLFIEAELIIVSPGVPLNIKPLEDARLKSIPITSEIEMAARLLKEPLIGVTGTNGKTTTTHLIREMFMADKKPIFAGGNIGTPLLEYFNGDEKVDYVVAELSSFQLETIEKLVPAVAVFTNITPDHLDRYADMTSYITAKKKLLTAAERNSYVVINYDDTVVSQFARDTQAKVLYFTKQNPLSIGGEFAERFQGAYFIPGSGQVIAKFSGKEESYELKRLKIFGDHNKENLMAAICAARALGVRPTAIQTVIDTFPGVEHRLEFVRKRDGVYFFNDSKATNVNSVIKSLMAFKNSPIILIAGGKDKDGDFAPLAGLVKEKCKLLILVGEAKEKINRAIGDYVETYLVGTFEEAVLLAYQKSRNGDIILLSPGCASFDMFRNYEERGEYFKKLVMQI